MKILKQIDQTCQAVFCMNCSMEIKEMNLKLAESLIESKDQHCWDVWMETIYEAGPQAILQLVILLLRTEPLSGFWGKFTR